MRGTDEIRRGNARRHFLAGLGGLAGLSLGGAVSLLPGKGRAEDLPGASAGGRQDGDPFPPVTPGRSLRFPRDHGAHPDFRTEWWYLTAVLDVEGSTLGLQLTFFRSRTPYGRDNPSRFAPTQLILAHVAISDPAQGRLLHAEQSWREELPVASFSTDDTRVVSGLPDRRWSFRRAADDSYLADIAAGRFRYRFVAMPSAHFPAPVLQGDAGHSRKGPEPYQASYYYSRPQLSLEGSLAQGDDEERRFTGRGWLDHEWSSEYLPEGASGWDWTGLNLADGGAIMSFRMRRRGGGVLQSYFRHFRSRQEGGGHEDHAVRFEMLREWTSPRTGNTYPVSLRLRAGPFDLVLLPLMDDQELDGTRSTGAVYYEGVVSVWRHEDWREDRLAGRQPFARGYLELSGYADDLSL